MVGRSIGRYHIISKLGQGGYASVWRARDNLLGRQVALKVLDEKLAESPKSRRRFIHEAQSGAGLDHPGIAAVLDSGQADGFVYTTFTLIEGETLSERIGRSLLPFDEAIRIVSDVADALSHAHEHQVIHRDVTSRNIMIWRDGRVVVVDFGLALAGWESRVTSTETTMGTAPYMAPELVNNVEADARSDVYGLGIVLYEALTGGFPFVAEQPQAYIYAAANLAPIPPRQRRPEIPEALEAVVLKAIARDPESRYPTAVAFREALRGLAPHERVATTGSGAVANGELPAPQIERAARAGVGAGTVGSPTYLAVLPFAAVESPGDGERVCATLASRLAETISTEVTKRSNVRVVPASASPLPADPRDIARQLGANVLLSGSVRRSGSQVRVEYSLRDPWRGLHMGGGVVDGSALQVFDVEDRVVASVARELGLSSGDPSRGPSRAADPAAHDRYLQALGYLKRYDNEASVDGAIHLLERLLASEGDVAIYHAALARAYQEKGELTRIHVWENRAAAECHRAYELEPDRPEVRIAVGRMKLRAGQHRAARADFETALASQPGSIDAILGLTRADLAAGRLAEAEQTCRTAVETFPNDWRGHLLLGRVRFSRLDFTRALASFQRVTELTPDNALGRRHVGSALYRLDRFEEAASAYRDSLAIQPNDEAYGNLGAALYFLGRYDEALTALQKATELTPTDALRWGYLGSALRWIPGREQEAAAPLERAVALMRERLERDPSQAEPWALLAAWLANLGRLDEARSAIEQAIRLAPDDLQCMVQAGDVYHQLGERETCLRWLSKARRAGYGAGELRRSREFAPLANDPGFQRLLREPPDLDGEDG